MGVCVRKSAGIPRAACSALPRRGHITPKPALAWALGLERNLPLIGYTREMTRWTGMLMTYGASNVALFSRAAYFVEKILKGVKPGDLPVEQPTKIELVINLKTAKTLGLTIPPSLLQRADQVIE